MDRHALFLMIEQKRKQLNDIVSKNICLSSNDILKISNELDELIAAYICITQDETL